MQPLRICQLITELGPAGAERCVYELARRLDRERFDVQVVALRGGAVADWLTEAGIEVSVLGVRGKWDFLNLLKMVGLTELLRSRRIDILHTHLFHADLAGRPAAKLAGVPHLVNTVHVAEGRFRPWQFAYARLLCESCDRIVCVSETVREFHAKRTGLPDWRYRIIRNGVDPDAYARSDEARRRLREQWGLGEGDFLVAFVGRLDYQKGIGTLLGALSHLGARGSAIRTVLAGDGPKRGIVENFIAHGEGGSHCRLLGHVDDVRAVLSAADVLAMPSRWEGFGLAALEAMAAGLPVVATHVPGLSEVVADGETGVLIDRNDSVALADALEVLRGDPARRRRLAAAGSERARTCFHIDDNIAAHEQLYLELASRAKTGDV